jgi:hypothetical protein
LSSAARATRALPSAAALSRTLCSESSWYIPAAHGPAAP